MTPNRAKALLENDAAQALQRRKQQMHDTVSRYHLDLRDAIELVGVGLDQLADLLCWVAWREEERRNLRGELVRTKVPYDPRTGRRAESNDPTTWGTRQQA